MAAPKGISGWGTASLALLLGWLGFGEYNLYLYDHTGRPWIWFTVYYDLRCRPAGSSRLRCHRDASREQVVGADRCLSVGARRSLLLRRSLNELGAEKRGSDNSQLPTYRDSAVGYAVGMRWPSRIAGHVHESRIHADLCGSAAAGERVHPRPRYAGLRQRRPACTTAADQCAETMPCLYGAEETDTVRRFRKSARAGTHPGGGRAGACVELFRV
jgi:hypothetical protein